MVFKKKKGRQFVSSHTWREMIYNRMMNDSRLEGYLRDGLLSITKLLLTLDTFEIRQQIKSFVMAGDERKIQKLANKIPFDFDEKDYDTIGLYFLINKSGTYFIILGEDYKNSEFTFVDVVKGDDSSLLGYDPIIQVYPL